MENKSKTNTVLLVIIIILLVAGLVYVLLNKPKKEIINTPNQENQNDVTNISVDNNTLGWSSVSANSMSVTVPENYSHNTEVARAAGDSAVALNIAYNNKTVVSIYKWNNQALFTEVSNLGADNYTSVDMNYKINNTAALYYKAKAPQAGQLPGEDIVVVPSKLIIIQISPASWIGISQSTLDQIVSSIKF